MSSDHLPPTKGSDRAVFAFSPSLPFLPPTTLEWSELQTDVEEWDRRSRRARGETLDDETVRVDRDAWEKHREELKTREGPEADEVPDLYEDEDKKEKGLIEPKLFDFAAWISHAPSRLLVAAPSLDQLLPSDDQFGPNFATLDYMTSIVAPGPPPATEVQHTVVSSRLALYYGRSQQSIHPQSKQDVGDAPIEDMVNAEGGSEQMIYN